MLSILFFCAKVWYNEDMKKENMEFPPGFLWGAATAAHQVEGGNHNNWTEWEKKNAARLAQGAEKKYGSWLKSWFKFELEAKNPQNYISGKSSDHYNKFEEDFELAQQLNHTAHRFSIEWSRIEPEQGCFDQKQIEHYKKVILALRQRRIEPVVTLWHWTCPLWFYERGGWLNKEAPLYFANYVKKIVSNLGNLINIWVTINEPCIFIKNHTQQDSPRLTYNYFSLWKIARHLIAAHKRAYAIIHSQGGKNKVGITKNCIDFEGWPLSAVAGYYWNHYFLNKIKNYQDFIGLNYYRHYKFGGNNSKEISDLGWEIYPEGIYHVLKDLNKYQKPIYITENGLADKDDFKRAKFIIQHLKWIHRAIADGIDVRGYLHWSLLDNFEWDKGFWPRFGLIEVNYKTLQRKTRSSAKLYAQICLYNKLTINK